MAVPRKRIVDVAANATATAGDISVVIDPASTVPTPSAGTIFINQAEIDAYLTANSGTAFKYLQDYADTVPQRIEHVLVINLVAGVHRPRPAETILLLERSVGANGLFTLQGAAIADWNTVHAGGTIVAHQLLKEVTGVSDPYVDCAAATFPNDGSLNGRFAVFDNGFYSQIWDHDDERLWLNTDLSPAPVDGVTTVSVMQPSTILRNSIDDLVKVTTAQFIKLAMGASIGLTPHAHIYDIYVQDWSSLFAMTLADSNYRIYRTIIDKIQGPMAERYYGVRIYRGNLYLYDCGFLATPGGGAEDAVDGLSKAESIAVSRTYIQGFDWSGLYVNGGYLSLYNAVIRGSGKTYGAVFAKNSALIYSQNTLTGVVNTILDTPTPTDAEGAFILDGFFPLELRETYGSIRFRDNACPCIVLKKGAQFSFGTGAEVVDGGGNTDVGFLLIGPQSALTFGDHDILTGANGDVKFGEDSSIWSYNQIEVLGPITDDLGNLVKK